MRKWIIRIAFICGFLILCYPIVSSIMQARYQSRAIATYDGEVEEKDDTEIQEMLEDAQYYNSMLYQSQGASIGDLDTTVLSDDNYSSLLNQGTGAMASIEIPKIDVSLPIYHGTSDEVLQVGVGHQQGSSLPVGGESTRSVLTGHRGLPGSKLFTRLDEMEEGDLFFINVLGETLAYQVVEVEVVEPTDVEEVLHIESGRDLVTLVTCTPYGLNTHRLIVTGERTAYSEQEYESIESELPSFRELAFAALPFIFLAVVVVLKVFDWRKAKHEKIKEQLRQDEQSDEKS